MGRGAGNGAHRIKHPGFTRREKKNPNELSEPLPDLVIGPWWGVREKCSKGNSFRRMISSLPAGDEEAKAKTPPSLVLFSLSKS